MLNASAEFLKATSIECFILSIAYCFTGYFNGVERTTFVMVQGLLSIFLVKIPYAWFASTRPEPSLFQIGMSTAWAAIFTLLLCVWYYIHCSGKEKYGLRLIRTASPHSQIEAIRRTAELRLSWKHNL